ncbi:MAG: N-acetyl sugar amidotransferase [Chitinophagaceae bacterium]|nr:N-acetyl sugar amidotransferase [Chitinophagaceae bacterium]
MKDSKLKTCTRCLMDRTATDIKFDTNDICNFCTDYLIKTEKLKKSKDALFNIDKLVEKIKKDGIGKEYDCIVGVSGGVDSSFTLFKVKELGLRPLAVHLDNGWNSETAVSNIKNLVTKLNVDLYTHVIDWNENKEMQLAFFKANVVDIEMIMDNAQAALNFKMAKKYNLHYILSGSNTATEGIIAPKSWVHYKFDVRNIKDIVSKFSSIKIKTHPLISTLDYILLTKIYKIKWEYFLDYLDYNKSEALAVLVNAINYKPYEHKHYESVFTRFYQGYILPNKFNIDKRKMHLSMLILNNEITRDEGIKIINKNPYSDSELLRRDKEFVQKKLGITDSEFEKYISSKEVTHENYKSEVILLNSLLKIKSIFKKNIQF